MDSSDSFVRVGTMIPEFHVGVNNILHQVISDFYYAASSYCFPISSPHVVVATLVFFEIVIFIHFILPGITMFRYAG